MEPPGRRHWRVKEKDQSTRKQTLAEGSGPGCVYICRKCCSFCASSWAHKGHRLEKRRHSM
eukprot:1160763-Pelagomonas_calceolata.AAC.13